MSKVTRMEIVFHNSPGVFYPGQMLGGQLHVDLKADMALTAIRVECNGKGKVYWSEGGENDDYKAKEKYIETGLTLYGSNTQREVALLAGKHVFPFQFQLPVVLPSSFEANKHCYIRYWLEGVIHRSLGTEGSVTKYFSLGSIMDLNTIPEAKRPAQICETKTISGCCYESGPITASVKLDKTGYVPGEAIVCHAEIEENSDHAAQYTQLALCQTSCVTTRFRRAPARGRNTHSSLCQKITFKASKRRHVEYRECARLQHGALSPGVPDVYDGERLVVPPLPPSSLPGSNIMQLDYIIKCTMGVHESSKKFKLELGVIIGTIPLRSVAQQGRLKPNAGPVTSQPASIDASGAVILPPPSYKECMFGKVNIAEDEETQAIGTGSDSFAPSYTYYEELSPPSAATAPPID